jgi:hypothetical protein
MGEIKVSGIPEDELARLRTEAEKLGLSLESYVRLKLIATKDRAATARAIRARQKSVARRDSVDLIREDRNSR